MPMLLIDCCENSGIELDLQESRGGRIKFRGKFQEADTVNKNKRMYPFHVLDENVKKLQEAIKARSLVGELDHPTDSVIHYANTSHVITKLWWEGNILMGEGEILNTPAGKVLKALIEDGIRVGISSRGVGSGTTNEDGILVVNENYKLITFDAVAEPSTYQAFQKKVTESNNYYTHKTKPTKPKKKKKFIKNENTCIDTVNKEALLACLYGYVDSQIREYKARLR